MCGPLLQVILEKYRYDPVEPIMLPHLATRDGELAGYFIPKNTEVGETKECPFPSYILQPSLCVVFCVHGCLSAWQACCNNCDDATCFCLLHMFGACDVKWLLSGLHF